MDEGLLLSQSPSIVDCQSYTTTAPTNFQEYPTKPLDKRVTFVKQRKNKTEKWLLQAPAISTWGVNGKGTPEQPCSSSKSSQILFSSNLSFCYSNIRYCLSLRSHQTLLSTRFNETKNSAFVVASAKADPLKIMISGAPASGKGTQCELITKKYGLVHIAAGDLLRAEIASGSENGKRAKEYMEKGQLVPNEIVVMMVKERLLLPDSQENGWLLDGYPRSLLQATALKEFGFQPDLFILLEVNEEILVERVVGRRLDPVKDIPPQVNGNVPKEDVFAQIDGALTKLLEDRKLI
uniref:adenylate kinase n=1 Tax=Populus alba TaxID=43335 RepID=A0A4U5Q9S8_POPAL|nr:hypothetical protein D5086_0000116820 [Populus alba]